MPPLFSSFKPEALAGAQATAPHIPRALLIDTLWDGCLDEARRLLAEYEARRAAHLAVEATAEADLPAELRGNERVDTYTRCSRYLAGRARARRLADAGV